jgi:hypothetical protein
MDKLLFVFVLFEAIGDGSAGRGHLIAGDHITSGTYRDTRADAADVKAAFGFFAHMIFSISALHITGAFLDISFKLRLL